MTGAQEALGRAVPLLRCPQCAERVEAEPAGSAAAGDSGAGARITGVRCASGHSFDRARQGFLTLFGPRGRRFVGDTTEQILARERVLRSGVFDRVASMLVGIARDELAGTGHSGFDGAGPEGHDGAPRRSGVTSRDPGPVILEAGAGTGFYLGRVLEGVRVANGPNSDPGSTAPLGLGTEISVAAARRLAKADPDAVALVADTWDVLPLADDSVDLVQVVFAPRNASEFARVLRPGGGLVVVGPGAGHLEPLRSDAGMLSPESDKAERLESGLAGFFSPARVEAVDETVRVPGAIAVDLALMGPSGVHLDRADLERALGGTEREVRVHVVARTFHAAG